MYEKRVHIRIPAGIEGSYQPITRLAAPRLGITLDISLGGARFASTDHLEPGAKVSMVLSLPKQGPVTLTGLVVWSRSAERRPGETGYEAGLCWENVDAHAQARLNSFLTDYTRFEEPVIITGGSLRLPDDWTRALIFLLGAALGLSAAAVIWLKQYTLTIENQSLQTAIQSYQQQIKHFVTTSR